MTTYPGIDYSNGQANFSPETGIHFGVIPVNAVLQAWCDSSEPSQGEPTCPKCGNEVESCEPFNCLDCQYTFDSDEAYSDEVTEYQLDSDGYKAFSDSHNDIMILESPFYTFAQFCSPCAPGAGYLLNPCECGVKTYCFGHDFFDNNQAPYPVFSVATNERIEPSQKE